MLKLQSILRRLKLGEKFKHQYNCHPGFDLRRGQNSCKVIWKKSEIAEIPYASSIQGQFSDSCFIVASGPSLAEIDLTKIASYDSISLNCAIKKFNEFHIKPTHCIIVDHRVFERQWQCVKDTILSGANCFFSYEGLSRICEQDPALLRTGKIYLIESISRQFNIARHDKAAFLAMYRDDADVFLDKNLLEYCRSIGFCGNLKKGVFSGKTVATWAVQLAYGLGYKQQFIIGMDLGGTGKSHFYADGKNPAPDFMKDYEPHIRGCFELAKQASQARGFSIYNLSKHSTLPHEIIPKISLDEALSLAQNNPTH